MPVRLHVIYLKSTIHRHENINYRYKRFRGDELHERLEGESLALRAGYSSAGQGGRGTDVRMGGDGKDPPGGRDNSPGGEGARHEQQERGEELF